MGRIFEDWSSKENKNYKETGASNQKETTEILETHEAGG